MYSDFIALPEWVILIAQFLLSFSMLITAWRIWKGPSVADRIVALDLLASMIIAQSALLVFTSGFVSYLDVGGVVAVLSFLATVAFSRYLESHHPINQ